MLILTSRNVFPRKPHSFFFADFAEVSTFAVIWENLISFERKKSKASKAAKWSANNSFAHGLQSSAAFSSVEFQSSLVRRQQKCSRHSANSLILWLSFRTTTRACAIRCKYRNQAARRRQLVVAVPELFLKPKFQLKCCVIFIRLDFELDWLKKNQNKSFRNKISRQHLSVALLRIDSWIYQALIIRLQILFICEPPLVFVVVVSIWPPPTIFFILGKARHRHRDDLRHALHPSLGAVPLEGIQGQGISSLRNIHSLKTFPSKITSHTWMVNKSSCWGSLK